MLVTAFHPWSSLQRTRWCQDKRTCSTGNLPKKRNEMSDEIDVKYNTSIQNKMFANEFDF